MIKVSTDDTVPAGWEVTINKQVRYLERIRGRSV